MSTQPCGRVAEIKYMLLLMVGIRGGDLLGGSIRGQEGGLFLRVLTLRLRPPS